MRREEKMDTRKKASDHYRDLAEGVRLAVCGATMLAVCGVKSAVKAVRKLSKKGGSCVDGEVIDADYTVKEDRNG